MSLNLKNMSTETRNQNTMNLDIMTPLEVVTVMNNEDAKVPEAIKPALPNIAQCVTWPSSPSKPAAASFTWAQAPAAVWACWTL